ncbi:CoA pyrophosphatase [Corynebacterium uropygiale]|uniref:CoA pyrophosphatase n=1 Tax=Corynebacterium uropygiale TaxID=1775911 RepID=A0A9X1QN90_9CORY|nr:CoA pyrophosphatase [Corynebacterium uropygiale]MCF4005746.1 CoA pyrophosphatase [Corynebacterium uropygiale]
MSRRSVATDDLALPGWLRGLYDSARRTAPATPGLDGRPAGTRPRRGTEPGRHSAVLLMFSGESWEDGQLLLTHRSPSMRSHAGQVAFPGGRVDPGDRDVIDTALREAAEETGLDRAGVTPLLTLPDAHTHRGASVSPVLAWSPTPGRVWAASPEETDHVFYCSLPELVRPENRLMVGRRHPRTGAPWRGPAFWAEGYLVWGFTAGVLAGVLAAGGWEDAWDRDTTYPLAEMIRRSRNNEKLNDDHRGPRGGKINE